MINVDFEELHKVRGHVLKAMKKLDRAKTLKDRAVLEQVIECCLRPAQNKELKTCVLVVFFYFNYRIVGMILILY